MEDENNLATIGDQVLGQPLQRDGLLVPESQIVSDDQAVDYEQFTDESSRLLSSIKLEKNKIFISHASVGERAYKGKDDKNEALYVKLLEKKLEETYPKQVYLSTNTADYSDNVHLLAAHKSTFGVFVISPRYIINYFDLFSEQNDANGYSTLQQEYQVFHAKQVKSHCPRMIQVVFGLHREAYEDKPPFSSYIIFVEDYLSEKDKDPFNTIDPIAAKIVEQINFIEKAPSAPQDNLTHA